jgi:hypothetical protein
MQIIIDNLDIVGYAQSFRPYHKVTSNKKIIVRDLPAGWRNLHINVDFDAGSRWIARFPRSGYYSYPRILQKTVMEGEIDMLRWLRLVPQLPVPKVMSPVISK